MRRAVKHFSSIIRPNAGVNADMHYKKTDQKQSCQCHHKFFSDRRRKKFRPFHMIDQFKIDPRLQLQK
jgi:hypothetical protein